VDIPPWVYPKFIWMLGSEHPPAIDGFHTFSNGRHWRYTASAKARVMMVMMVINPASRILHCRALLKKLMKKRHIETLLSVALMRYHGCPMTKNCTARVESDVVLSRMPKMVPSSAIT
jgi:hypothetical protein